MRNDSDRLQWQTEKNYIMNTFHNGLRRIQTDSKTAQQYVLLCLALAVAALIMVSGGSGEDVISVVFRPFVNFIRVIAWLAECLGVIYLFGYIPHSWSYYDDFSRAGICNQAHEAPLLVNGYEADGIDYRSITQFEQTLGVEEAEKRLLRLSKKELISLFRRVMTTIVCYADIKGSYDTLAAVVNELDERAAIMENGQTSARMWAE